MLKYIIPFCLFVTPCIAQQADSAFLQRAVSVLQAQRNAALDQAAVAEARASGLQDDLTKAQARIKELEPKKDESAK